MPEQPEAETPKHTAPSAAKPQAQSGAPQPEPAKTEQSKAEQSKAAQGKAGQEPAAKADAAGKNGQKSKSAGKKMPFSAALFAAAAGGSIIALAAGAVLLNSGLRPPQTANAERAAAPAQRQPPANAAPERRAAEADRLFAAQLKAELQAQLNAQAEQMRRALQAQQAAAHSAAGAEAAAPAAAETEAHFAALRQQIQALAAKQEAQAQQLAAMGAALTALKAQLAANARQNREILFKTDALREEAALIYASRQNGQKQLARLAALQGLQAALASGAPYAAQLQLFNAAFPHIWQETAGGAAALAVLRQRQETGLPDNAALSAGFAPLADRLAAMGGGGSAAGEGAGLWQTLRRRLSPWISLRPQGAQTQGASPSAQLARIEAALKRGEGKAALEETLKLPPHMQNEVRAYLAPLAARLAAQQVFGRAAPAVFPAAAAGAESGAEAAAKGSAAAAAKAAASSAAAAGAENPAAAAPSRAAAAAAENAPRQAAE